MKLIFKSIYIFLLCVSCQKNLDVHEVSVQPFSISIIGSDFVVNDTKRVFKGVNCLQTYGLNNQDLLIDWKVSISREFIGNLKDQPISGNPILAQDGQWYHSLESIVKSNRSSGIITILTPFGWNDETGNYEFSGLNPSDQPFYSFYKDKMREIASFFKGQSDVWLEVWNEPYHWDNKNNYSHELWYTDMSDMVSNLREVKGFDNIVLVPGNEQGQAEAAIIAYGKDLLKEHNKVAFDIHAYEKWLLNSSKSTIYKRLIDIKSQGIPFIIGEISNKNVGGILPVIPFLEASKDAETSVLAWLWKYDSHDVSALLNDQKKPNCNVENDFWGCNYKSFLDE